MTGSPRGRCPEHDVALDPNGSCVVCRRARHPELPKAHSSSGWAVLAIFGVLVVALAAIMSYRAVERVSGYLERPPGPLGPSLAPEPIPAAPTTTRDEAPAPSAELEPEPPQEPRARPRARRQRQASTAQPQAPPQESPQDEPPQPAARRPQRDQHALSAARRRVRITMYSTRWCGYCRRAREYMRQEGIAFIEHDVESDPRAATRMRALNPRGGVPTFDIDGLRLVGFSPTGLEQVIDEAAIRRM